MENQKKEERALGKGIRPEGSTPRSYLWECSVCGRTSYWAMLGKRGEKPRCAYEYCPRCGVKMEEEAAWQEK